MNQSSHTVYAFNKLTSQNSSLVSSQGCFENPMDFRDMHEFQINIAK